MFKVRTDLALETREAAVSKGMLDDGILFSEERFGDISCSTIEVITPQAKEQTGREIGAYVTVEFGRLWMKDHETFKRTVDIVAGKIRQLCGESGGFSNEGAREPRPEYSVLVAGLGNSSITADSLGPRALSNIIVTRHLKEQAPELYEDLSMTQLSAVAPGVLGQTGIESAAIIESISMKIKPSLVIVIDALASRKIARLATTVQLSNTGISPGSGVGNHRAAINSQLLGTKVISIGVPTVVDAATLAFDVLEETCEKNAVEMDENLTHAVLKNTLDSMDSNFFVTPKESDIVIGELSKLIGFAINRAFYDDISFEEMTRMV